MTYQNTGAGVSQEINISPRLINFLQIINGATVSPTQAQEINEGKSDFIIGLVAFQNYDPDPNVAPPTSNLAQVTIRTHEGEDFILTNNQGFKLDPAIFKVLNNAYLFNSPKDIYITNLNEFQDKFQDAARYGQMIACIYSRVTYEITYLSLQTNQDYLSKGDHAKSAYCITWPCHT